MLPVSLDCLCFVFETGNIGYTRRRKNKTKTIRRNWQHRVYKTKKKEKKLNNPEKLAT
jgi:hypothetical protein